MHIAHVSPCMFQWVWTTRYRCAPGVLRRKRNSVPDPACQGTGIVRAPNSSGSGCDGGGSELYCTYQLPSATHTTVDGNNGHEYTVVEGRRMVPTGVGWGGVSMCQVLLTRLWMGTMAMNTQWWTVGKWYPTGVGWGGVSMCQVLLTRLWMGTMAMNTQWWKVGEWHLQG